MPNHDLASWQDQAEERQAESLAVTRHRVSLYEIEDYVDALINSEDSITPEQEIGYRSELAAALHARASKRDSVAHFLRACDHHEQAIDAEIDRLQRLKKTWQSGRDRMRRYVAEIIESLGTDERGKFRQLKGETTILAVQRNPKHVEVTDPSMVPHEFKNVTLSMPAAAWCDLYDSLDTTLREVIRVESSIDKRAIRKAIDSGEAVPGARLEDGDLRLVVK